MEDYGLFVERLERLDVKEQNRVIGSIFNLSNVKLYTLSLEGDGEIAFRVFDGKRYYKFTFVFCAIGENFIKLDVRLEAVNCIIYVNSYMDIGDEVRDNSNFFTLVKFFKDGNISYLSLLL